MKPVNNKSLLHFIFDQMEKLDNASITVEQAKAQANLAKQANNSLKYELERATTLMKISEHRINYNNDIELREAEGKNFD
jgi:propanediol dehydratase small subunit